MIITDPAELREAMEAFSEEMPDSIKARIERGDLIKKSLGHVYEIDNPDIYRDLDPDAEPGRVPCGAIFKKFKSCEGKTAAVFMDEGVEGDRYRVLPYSRVFELGVGSCLEKAVMTHLFAQRGRPAFLITGVAGADDDFLDGHAYNIIFKDSVPYLVDTENPMVVEENGKPKYRPFIAPVTGLCSDDGFLIPPEWDNGVKFYSFKHP